ncbi:MAG: hypothetical protein LBG99_07580 [Propionibacteriaceae bacterium]|jgi:SAM-dependent methyltransferase|nr:hypothetical protein [Propionibacteriaceae bacterium]
MVQARHWFLSQGVYEPITEALVSITSLVLNNRDSALIADLGGGTGWYSRYILDRFPTLDGVLVDASPFAAKIAAKVHSRLVVGTADLWSSIPLSDSSVDLALVIFAPRNPEEIARILNPDGTCVVVTPGKHHLAELRTVVPMLGIEPDKEARLFEQFSTFHHKASTELDYKVVLSSEEITSVVAMGPSAFHLSCEDLPAVQPTEVTVSVRIHEFRL